MSSIQEKDIHQFQTIAKKAAPLKFAYLEPETVAKTDEDAHAAAADARRWAKAIGSDGHRSTGDDMDSRLTVIKTNISTGDRDSAVLAIVGLLQTRIEQLHGEQELWNGDEAFQRIAESLGINNLPASSLITQAYEEYQQLVIPRL